MSIGRQIAIVVLLFAVVIGSYTLIFGFGGPYGDGSGNSGGQRFGRDAASPVLTTPLTFASENLRIEAVGTAKALQSASLYPASSGEVIMVNIVPNAMVTAGDVLLQLDSRSEELATELAAVRLRNAEQLLARYERTAGSGAVPASTIDEARNAVEEARIEQRQAAVALADRTLKAPFDGNVGLTDVEPGDRIGPDDMVTTIDDRSALLITFQIPENYLDRVVEGQSVQISTWSSDARTIEGRVVDIDSRIDPLSRSVTARARIDEPESWLRPGMSFAVSIDLPGRAYPNIPEIALQWGGDGAFFWTVRDDKAVRHRATIIQRQAGTILVDAVAEPGARLVVEGIQRLRPGIPVQEAQTEPVLPEPLTAS